MVINSFHFSRSSLHTDKVLLFFSLIIALVVCCNLHFIVTEFCTFCDTSYMETLLHVSTRWLSLEMVVSRILRLYKALKSYFGSIRKYKPSFDFETYLMYPSNVTRYQFFACHKFTQCQGIWKCFKIIIYLFCCASIVPGPNDGDPSLVLPVDTDNFHTF